MWYVLSGIFWILSVQIISKSEGKCMYSGLQFTGQCAQTFKVRRKGNTFSIEIKEKLKTSFEPKYLIQSQTGEMFFVWNDKEGGYFLLKGNERCGLRFCSVDVAIFRNDYYEIRFQQSGRHGILTVPLERNEGSVAYNDLRQTPPCFKKLQYLEFEIK